MTYYSLLNRKIDYYITKYETATGTYTLALEANASYSVKVVGAGGGCCNYTGVLGGAIMTLAVGGGSGAYIKVDIVPKFPMTLTVTLGKGGVSQYSVSGGSFTPGGPGADSTLVITTAQEVTALNVRLGGGLGGHGSVWGAYGGRGGTCTFIAIDDSQFNFIQYTSISNAEPGTHLGAMSPYNNKIGRDIVGAGGGTTEPGSSSSAYRYNGGNGACSIIASSGTGTYYYSEYDCSAVKLTDLYYNLQI